MRPFAIVLAAASILPLAAPSFAQLPTFKPGDAVDFYSFGKWIPCAVAAPLAAGTYNLRCGSIELRAKNDPRELRVHVVPPMGMMSAFGVQTAPAPAEPVLNVSVGARYGTRDPRICNRRPARLSPEEAKEIFICDAEHEFDGSLYLVSGVALDLAAPRPFDPRVDSRKVSIDRTQPVIDLHATYNDFQCSPLPATHMDNPNNRNCEQFHANNAVGSCFKSVSGEWHCLLTDPTVAGMTSTAKNVGPPTLVE